MSARNTKGNVGCFSRGFFRKSKNGGINSDRFYSLLSRKEILPFTAEDHVLLEHHQVAATPVLRTDHRYGGALRDGLFQSPGRRSKQ